MPKTRRDFLVSTALLSAAVSVSATPDSSKSANTTTALPHLLHHVFFWLKNPDSTEDLAQLVAGVKALGAIETVRSIHVGVPASTEKREVVDNSYHVSELLCFDDVDGQNIYQAHPLHQKFIDECSHLWAKVVVYDALAV
jgi:hypothetical protein